jgi:hypothetical protein
MADNARSWEKFRTKQSEHKNSFAEVPTPKTEEEKKKDEAAYNKAVASWKQKKYEKMKEEFHRNMPNVPFIGEENATGESPLPAVEQFSLPDAKQQPYIGSTDLTLFAKANPSCYRLNVSHKLIRPRYENYKSEFGCMYPSNDDRDDFENLMIGELLRDGLITTNDIYEVDKRNEAARQKAEQENPYLYEKCPRHQCGNSFAIQKDRPFKIAEKAAQLRAAYEDKGKTTPER